MTPLTPAAPGSPEFDRIADELYGAPVAEFIAARDSRAGELRAAGDRSGAAAVKALRRPTQSAWLVNQLVRARREIVDELAAVGEALRQAESTLTGAALRDLGRQRSALVAAMVAEARRVGAELAARVDSTVLGEVQATLEAALADPGAADEVRRARLVQPLAYASLGGLTTSSTGPRPAVSAPAPVDTTAARASRTADSERAEKAAQAARVKAAKAALRAATTAERKAAGERDAREQERDRLAQQLDQLREEVTEVERRLASASLDARSAAARHDAATEAVRVAGLEVDG